MTILIPKNVLITQLDVSLMIITINNPQGSDNHVMSSHQKTYSKPSLKRILQFEVCDLMQNDLPDAFWTTGPIWKNSRNNQLPYTQVA
jgi:hypothetical protein